MHTSITHITEGEVTTHHDHLVATDDVARKRSVRKCFSGRIRIPFDPFECRHC
jgi:hypothetical protein